jgi:hypothetical protein
MGNRRVRVVILCEDRAQEHFFRRLCERLDRRPRIVIAPKGQGSAEQWVRKHYRAEVQAYRRQQHERVALLTVIDGDRYGVEARKKELEEALREAGFEVRQDDERMAVCVPTWSIETWFVWLCGVLEEVDEGVQYKDAARGMAASPPRRPPSAGWRASAPASRIESPRWQMVDASSRG